MMTPRTRLEISRCLKFLSQPDISPHDREQAERGLNDWFCQSIFDEFGDLLATRQPKKSPETGKSEVQESI